MLRSREPSFPWRGIVAGAAAILVGVSVAWWILEEALLRDAPQETLYYFYLTRGAVAAMLVLAYVLLLMVRRLRSAEAAEARFRTLLDLAPDAVIIADHRGSIALANGQAERVFGYRRHELLGRSADALVAQQHEALHRAHREAVLADPAGAAAKVVEVEGQRKDGARFPAEVSLGHVPGPTGSLVTLVVRDLTERRRAEEDRSRSMEQLRELERLREMDRFKTQFINMAAHELNTPLTPIKLQLEMFRLALGEAATQDQAKSLAILDRNVDRLRQLVQDVLEVARLQAGRLGIERAPFDLNRVVFEAAESFQEPARRAGVAMETRLTPGLSIEGDARRLTQVLFNLLSNALKFTPPGGKVSLETFREGGLAVVRVRDSGAGLRAEDIPKLFQPFSQVHDPAQRTRAGTGLGLYISKGIVELHGGRIGVESAGPGRGATFTFAVPVDRPPADMPHHAVLKEPQDPSQPEDALARRLRELV
jgi:PAS domain S-box-containing protein